MQNSLSGEILPQLKQTTYPMKSPTFSANVSEIMLAVSPIFSVPYTVLTDYLEAFITHSHACNTSLFSTNFTVAPNLAVLYYRSTAFTTNKRSITFQPLDKASRTKHFTIQQNQALVAAQLSANHAFSSKVLQGDGVSTISADKPKVHMDSQRVIIWDLLMNRFPFQFTVVDYPLFSIIKYHFPFVGTT
jgi:hypothetical protein